jgi:hypothetical protein
LQQGEQMELGEWDLPPAQSFIVLVSGPDGKSVEGFPLRLSIDANHLGVAHNTDELGAVYFFAPPNSKTGVRVSSSDLNFKMNEHLKKTTAWDFNLSESTDEVPVFPISISQELIDIFHKSKSPKR